MLSYKIEKQALYDKTIIDTMFYAFYYHIMFYQFSAYNIMQAFLILNDTICYHIMLVRQMLIDLISININLIQGTTVVLKQ